MISRIPEVFVIVISSIVVCRVFRLDLEGLEVLGRVGDSSTSFNLPLPLPSIPKLPGHADIKL